jgi:MarR family transcriptional regulator, negative regulator of the multidrug operon emrRAB
MNNTSLQYEKLEANLERLRARMPDLPKSTVLLTRLLLHIGRGMASMLEIRIRPFGLTEAEFRVLTTLFSQPEGCAHPSDLCAKTSQSPANMSRISDALVGRDLITRLSSLHDRRKMVLRISEQGEELVRGLLPTMFEPLREMFKDFSEEEQLQLIGQLKLLVTRLDQALSQHGPERVE